MKTHKSIITRTASELADVLELSPLDAMEIEVRGELNDRIIQIVRRSRLTHAQVAKAAGASRSRITAILNRNTHEVSTDLLLRIAVSIGYRPRITLVKMKPAA